MGGEEPRRSVRPECETKKRKQVLDSIAGFRFPEGPVIQDDGSLLVVEIESGNLTRIRDGAAEVLIRLEGGPNGAAIGPDGHVYICNNGGFDWVEEFGILRPVGQASDYTTGRIEVVDLERMALTQLYDSFEGRRLNSPNDLVFDSSGGFYFTDTGKSRHYDRDHGAIYYARPDGSEIRRVVFPMITPNGIALSPDERTLYVSETDTARVWAFDVAMPGRLNLQPFPSPNGGRLLHGFGGYMRLDGMAVEANGNICVATIVDSGITVLTPDGEPVRRVPFDDHFVTNICFGGPEMQTAFVTLGGTGRVMKMNWPCAGLPTAFRR
jgi:gluconolactonase